MPWSVPWTYPQVTRLVIFVIPFWSILKALHEPSFNRPVFGKSYDCTRRRFDDVTRS